MYAAPRMVAERVFIGHDPADEAMLRALVKHLQPLVAAGRIETWDTTRISPGSDRRMEIQRELGRARLAVALVSADFLASAMADLLGHRRGDGLLVVPILARPCIVDGARRRPGTAAEPGRRRALLVAAQPDRFTSGKVAIECGSPCPCGGIG